MNGDKLIDIDAEEYSLRITRTADYGVSQDNVFFEDINNNNEGDLIFGAGWTVAGGNSRSGAIYFIMDEDIQTALAGGVGSTIVIDDILSENFAFRIIGGGQYDYLGRNFIMEDVDNDSKIDLVTEARNDADPSSVYYVK